MPKEQNKTIIENIEINYLVFYLLWKKLCPHGTFALYKEWNITAQRFSRAKDFGHIKIGEASKDLAKATGLSEKIFKGERRITTPIAANDEIWEKYLSVLNSDEAANPNRLLEVEELRNQIAARLVPVDFSKEDGQVEDEWYAICYYFQYVALKRVPLVNESLESLVKALDRKLTLYNLQKIDDAKLLNQLRSTLEEKLTLVNALLVVSEAEQKEMR